MDKAESFAIGLKSCASKWEFSTRELAEKIRDYTYEALAEHQRVLDSIYTALDKIRCLQSDGRTGREVANHMCSTVKNEIAKLRKE